MADLSAIKNSLLVRVLEESSNFKDFPEDYKVGYVSRMSSLPEKEQTEMAKFMIRNEADLGKKVLLSFLQHVNNVTEALTNVAAKDKAILGAMKASRQSNQI